LGDVVKTATSMRYSGVTLVPRKHVKPEFGVIVRNIHDDPKQGINYREGDIANWCIEAGKPYDLGLFLKCAPAALSKKNMLAFWDGFGEIFGMPIRIAKTTSNDENERGMIENMLSKMGAAFWGVFQEGTDIEIKETSRGDAYNVYDKRIDKANAEISKCILGQTMTIDSGSSLSQSEVHLEVFQNIVEQDRQFVANVVNDKLIPVMVKHGFPVSGLTFEWDETEEYTPQDMRTVEQMLVNGGYDIDPQYFIDKYGIPIIGKKEKLPLSAGYDSFFA
jgi:phage gp29-like protein